MKEAIYPFSDGSSLVANWCLVKTDVICYINVNQSKGCGMYLCRTSWRHHEQKFFLESSYIELIKYDHKSLKGKSPISTLKKIILPKSIQNSPTHRLRTVGRSPQRDIGKGWGGIEGEVRTGPLGSRTGPGLHRTVGRRPRSVHLLVDGSGSRRRPGCGSAVWRRTLAAVRSGATLNAWKNGTRIKQKKANKHYKLDMFRFKQFYSIWKKF